MRAFIVRPFSVKHGIDFDAVEKLLIAPALKELNIVGSTTMEIVQAGNIREDMFRLLVASDIVIADLSIHNANVFYELGIRHGLRPNATVMIRSQVQDHAYPFDLQTDRYLTYDAQSPQATVASLVTMLKETIDSSRIDSPVYQLLPRLKAPDPSVLKVVPRDFGEEVQLATLERARGRLRLLAHEVRGQSWESEGLRAVGRAQFSLKAHGGAKETFEWLRDANADDMEANQRLATTYEKLGDIPRSEIAIDRVISSPDVTRQQLAEVFSLRARNKKNAWRRTVLANTGKPLAAIQTAALQSPDLVAAQQAYAQAFSHDLNAYYPGVNALALLVMRVELAKQQPAVWNEMFNTDDEAAIALKQAERELQMLKGSTQLCIKSILTYLLTMRTPNEEDLLWAKITEADLAFLVGDRPNAVAQAYRGALANASTFAAGSVREQLDLFAGLQIRTEMARAALQVVDEFDRVAQASQPANRNVLIFAGHRVDAANRKTPRFPNTARAEAEAVQRIRRAVEEELAQLSGEVIGIASGASGGDILFHEVCEALGIKTQLYLALPPDDFSVASVAPAGPKWVARYRRLLDKSQPLILGDKKELPHWLGSKTQYDVWQRNNLWMLFSGLAENANRTTLLALWDGKEGDGPGGTENLVFQVQSRGHRFIHIDASGLDALR